jgi:hypothetical protein
MDSLMGWVWKVHRVYAFGLRQKLENTVAYASYKS